MLNRDNRDELLFLIARVVLSLANNATEGQDTDAIAALGVAVEEFMPTMPMYCRSAETIETSAAPGQREEEDRSEDQADPKHID